MELIVVSAECILAEIGQTFGILRDLHIILYNFEFVIGAS